MVKMSKDLQNTLFFVILPQQNLKRTIVEVIMLGDIKDLVLHLKKVYLARDEDDLDRFKFERVDTIFKLPKRAKMEDGAKRS